MSTSFNPAPEVLEIAQKLIPLHHSHLNDIRIEYIFTTKVPKRGSKEIWGTMRKVGSLAAYLAGDEAAKQQGVTEEFFVMTISEPVWEELTQAQKEALVDHELCHAGISINKKGDEVLGIIPHDLEEFTSIVKRHGLWREDVKRFAESTKNAKD